jgi:hypothetical protein
MAKRTCTSNSATEPEAMRKSWMNSFLECLAAPSALVLGIETVERLTCEVNP